MSRDSLKNDINRFALTAWTGGSLPPQEFHKNSTDFREIRSFCFRDQVKDCGGLDLWACAGTSGLDRARIFWNRATGTAWATLRNTLS